jgi:hypothetical protein
MPYIFNELLINVWYHWPCLVIYRFLMLKMLKCVHSVTVLLSAVLHSCTELTHHISTLRILKITDVEWLGGEKKKLYKSLNWDCEKKLSLLAYLFLCFKFPSRLYLSLFTWKQLQCCRPTMRSKKTLSVIR